MEDWVDFHRLGNANPAVVEHCDTGGRRLHWLGYRDRDGQAVSKVEDFLHVSDNQSVAVNAWRPKQPNSKKDNQCLVAYLGLDPLVSWSVTSSFPLPACPHQVRPALHCQRVDLGLLHRLLAPKLPLPLCQPHPPRPLPPNHV
jgi:hypothetical protein